MSADKIRSALGLLLDNPDDEAAIEEVARCVADGADADELRELEIGRVRLEQLQLWPAVAKVLALEVGLDETTDIAVAKTLELGRIFHEELYREDDAAREFSKALADRPDDGRAKEVLGEIEFGRANIEATVEHALVEALDSNDPTVQQSLYLRAAEQLFRYAPRAEETLEKLDDCLRQALALDQPTHLALTFPAAAYQ